MRKETIIGIIAFLILIVLFFNKIVFDPENAVTINSDLLRMTSLWESQITEDLSKNNELILWNADVYSGTPFIGSPLTTMFYPLSILFYFLPFHLVFPYIMVLNLFLMGIFFYIYLRLIKVSRFSSFLSTIIVVFSGMIILWSGIISFINAIMWFPLLLYLAERFISEKKLAFCGCIGLILGIEILGSGPQIFLYSSFMLFLYIALRMLYEKKGLLKISSGLLLAVTLGVLIGSVQLIPMLEYSKYSIRSEGLDYDIASMHSLPGYALITFLMPEFFGRGELYWGFWKYSSFSEQYIYVGLVTLVLLLMALFFVRKNKYASIFAMIALFAILFSFGRYLPIFWLFHKLPLFSAFRAPVRMMVFFVFSAAVISGLSLDALSNIDDRKKKAMQNILFALGILLFIAAVIAVISYIEKDKIIEFGKNMATKLYTNNADASRITRGNLSLEYFLNKVPSVFKNILNSIGIFLVLMASILFALYLWINDRIRLSHLKAALFIILIIDLFMFSAKFIEPKSFEEQFGTNPIIDAIKNDNDMFRVLSMRSYQTKDYLPQYLATWHNIQLASGCDAIFLKKYAEYSCYYGNCEIKADACIPIEDIKYPKMIDLLNIKYVISPKDLNDNSLTLVVSHNGANLFRNNDYMTRAFFLPKTILTEKENVLSILSGEKFEQKRYAVILKNDSIGENIGAGDYKPLNIIKYSPNKVVIEDKLASDGFVILSDVNYPGWKVYVDGDEAKLVDADYLLKGVFVSKGMHKIDFVYNPKTYKIGLYLSLASLFTTILIILIRKKSFNIAE